MKRKTCRAPSGYTILVVDDQESARIITRSLLEREGHRVLTAPGVEEALEVVRNEEVHLALVDYFMPGLTGEDFVRQVRAFDPYLQIILVTGYASDKPPRQMLAELDIQGYHDKAKGPEDLFIWIDVGLKAHRMVRELSERERLQSELIANVSHEFRTPLSIIGGYTELLLSGDLCDLDNGAVEPLKRVAEACRGLTELVGDFLRYARVEARVEEAHEHRICTARLVREMERLAGVLLDGKPVVFDVALEAPPEVFTSDAVKLRTILRNLLANAAKFTRIGYIRFRIAQRCNRVEFVIEDSGPGIAPHDVEAIFEPFRQLNGTMSREQGGVGLGLALSRKLARLLGGDLSVQSVFGEGSSFTLSLPAKAVHSGVEPDPLGEERIL